MGKLILLTVPIGNKDDLTFRAHKLLKEHNKFIAEDTRAFRSLLKACNISTQNKKIISFHDQSGPSKLNSILNSLDKGDDLVLVSEAGSPIVSDPAFPLIEKAILQGHKIETLPGVSSLIVALELSGLPPHPFCFHGFIARDKEKKEKIFQAIKDLHGTHIFFESPQRISNTLKILSKCLPEVKVVVARELTKKFESIHRFKACEFHKEEINLKGEFVLLLHIPKIKGLSLGDRDDLKIKELAHEYLDKGQRKKILSKLLAEIMGDNAKKIYAQLNK